MKIPIVEHDTSQSAKGLIGIIIDELPKIAESKNIPPKPPKTYFLNGAWGSGKTTYLETIKDNYAKLYEHGSIANSNNSNDDDKDYKLLSNIKSKRKLKFINLNVWEVQSHTSLIERAYRTLHPVYYRVSKIVLFIIFAATASISFKLIDPKTLSMLLLFIAIGLTALVAIWKFNGTKSNELYIYLFNCKIHINRTTKVLILDDFDRTTHEQQKDSYKLFNILHGKLPIIFVGDYENLQYDNNYMRKLVDKQIELPTILRPSNLWNDYIPKLVNEFSTLKIKDMDMDELKHILISEQRNARDLYQFNQMIEQVFPDDSEIRVQVDQQIIIIYLYLFHYEYYQKLQRNELIIESEQDIIMEIANNLNDSPTNNTNTIELEVLRQLEQANSRIYEQLTNTPNNQDTITIEPSHKLNKILNQLVVNTESLPSSYCINPNSYLIYETPTNLTSKETEDLINNDEQLLSIMQNQHFQFDEFYAFTNTKNYKTHINKDRILDYALKAILEGSANELIRAVIYNKNQSLNDTQTSITSQLPSASKDIDTNKVNNWERILKANKFDISQQLYFYEYFLHIGFFNLNSIFTNKYQLKLSLEIDEPNQAKEHNPTDKHNTSKVNLSDTFLKAERKDYYFLASLKPCQWLNNNRNTTDKWDKTIWEAIDQLSAEEFLYVLMYNDMVTLPDGTSVMSSDEIKEHQAYIYYTHVIDPTSLGISDYTKMLNDCILKRLAEKAPNYLITKASTKSKHTSAALKNT